MAISSPCPGAATRCWPPPTRRLPAIPPRSAVSRKRYRRLPRHLPQISARRAVWRATGWNSSMPGLRPLVSDGRRQGQLQCQPPRRAGGSWPRKARLDGAVLRAGRQMDHLARIWRRPSPMRWWRSWARKPRPAPPIRRRCPADASSSFEDMLQGFQKTWPGIALRPMAHMLGARLPAGAEGRAARPILLPLNQSGDTMAQVLFAMREEMALTLEDMVMRRTGIGQFGAPRARVAGQRRRRDGGTAGLG